MMRAARASGEREHGGETRRDDERDEERRVAAAAGERREMRVRVCAVSDSLSLRLSVAVDS
jgi:hypothetical protein